MQKKTKRIFSLIAILSITSTNLLGQDNIKLTGEIIDCKDYLSLAYAKVSLYSNDSLVKLTQADDLGRFTINNLSKGEYQIQTEFFYYPKFTQTISLKKDSLISICMTTNNIDSSLKSYVLDSMYFIYYFGRPSSFAEAVNIVAKKYGVQYFSMGCIPFGDFSKYNEVVNKILEFKNGNNWHFRFKLDTEKIGR